MDNTPGTVERAYQLARSGTVDTLERLIRQLKLEGRESVEAHLIGPTLRRELRALCRASWIEAGNQISRKRSRGAPNADTAAGQTEGR